jgi:hypothetical protein
MVHYENLSFRAHFFVRHVVCFERLRRRACKKPFNSKHDHRTAFRRGFLLYGGFAQETWDSIPGRVGRREPRPGITFSEDSKQGGTAEGNKQARIDSEDKILKFLQAIEQGHAMAEAK